MDSFYSDLELKTLGFKRIGFNVQISKKASFYGRENIEIGNNVRIDDFCVLSGKITIGNFVHISASVLIFGGIDGIVIGDYSGVSSRSAIYAISDDYSGNYLANASMPLKYRNVISKKTVIGKHVVIGTGCTVLPGSNIADGVAVGAMTLINKPITETGIYCGIPAKRIKERKNHYLDLEKELIAETSNNK